MGVYTRFKQKGAEGFRALIELMESTPVSRRQKMIDVGNAEDPLYTEEALRYVITFQDVLDMNEMELAELLSDVPAQVVAAAIAPLKEEVKLRFFKCLRGGALADVRLFLESQISLAQTGGAQLKMVASVRKMEKRGLFPKKAVPRELPLSLK
jgi:flagellar motor switch protein FliG